MSAILEIPEVRRRVSPISVADYHRLAEFNENGRRTELIRGIVIEKMSKSPLHSALAKALYDILFAIVPDGYVVRREDPLTLTDSEPEPDVAIVRGTNRDFRLAHPRTAEIVIEVAFSSMILDRENVSLYAEAGVSEYWIVNGSRKEIEVYRDLAKGIYQKKRSMGAVSFLTRVFFLKFESRFRNYSTDSAVCPKFFVPHIRK